MSERELTGEQEAAVDELRAALHVFAGALEAIRSAELPVVDAFRAAGIEIPSFVPASLLENLLAPAA